MRLDRRQLLKSLGLTVMAVPILQACNTTSSATVDSPPANTDGATTTTGDAPSGSDWASGGTVSMTGKADYPDPFGTAATTCALVDGVTEGPCTTQNSIDREDVSEGWTGLPVRLAIRLVDSSCAPVVGAVVKIWHTNLAGSYSGVTPNPTMCLTEQSYSSANFMRGTRTSDANGAVYFDTCFPGWYRGRAVHIHFQVTSGSTTYKVSQLFFPEDLTAAIFTSHPEYKQYGQPDTTFANDNVMAGIPSADRSRNILDYARMTDGAMLASKTVTVT